jgi:1-deoxy-D-xylulose-5-phosphate synthase
VAILPTLQGPADLRGMSDGELRALAAEIRATIISTVATTGGHLGSSLGVVELTIALHRILESPRDRIVWDTGHQAYPHKLLTGRYERFATLRQLDGVGGFPRRSESPHDVFDGGHAGTGLSIAQGLATARDERHGLERIAVVVGDAALMSGLSLEALNDIGHRRTQMLIVLNDNEMSISPTVGALSKYLSTIKLSSTWRRSKNTFDEVIRRIPITGPLALELTQRFRQSIVNFAQPGRLFEDLGITYIGVVPGHDLRALDRTLRSALELDGPVIVHVRTRKGRGYRPAERDQVGFHGAALPPMVDTYEARGGGNGRSPDAAAPTPVPAATAPTASAPAATALVRRSEDGATPPPAPPSAAGSDDATAPAAETAVRQPRNYTAHFADELIAAAVEDRRIVAITAGMPTGTGLNRFQAAFPDRFIDVGIAEQHAVTLATGLALGGQRPVVAIYSTFLQRAFDQTVHDVCQNDQPVLLACDRAGLVGEDGTSHQGMFTLPAQRSLPHLVIASPKDEQELRSLVRTALAQDHPFALHYPRDPGFGVPAVEPRLLPIGQGELLRDGRDILLVGFGPIVGRATQVAAQLARDGWSVAVINARYAKPLDRQLILEQARGKRLVVTLEESVVTGGFGSGVLELIEEARFADPAYRETAVRIVGIPGDRFVDHGSVADLRRVLRLDAAGLSGQIRESIASLRLLPRGEETATA